MGTSLENLHVDLLLNILPPEAVQDEKALIFVTESLMMTGFILNRVTCKTEVADP